MKTSEAIALEHLHDGGALERVLSITFLRDGGTMAAQTDKAKTYLKPPGAYKWSDTSYRELSGPHSAYIDQRCRDYADGLEFDAIQVRKRCAQ